MDGIVEDINPNEQGKRTLTKLFMGQGLLIFITGFILLVAPTFGLKLVSFMAGLLLVSNGIRIIIVSVKENKTIEKWWLPLIKGCGFFIGGILILWFPLGFTELWMGFPLVLGGILFLYNGISNIIDKGVGRGFSKHSLIHDIALIILGIILLSLSPVKTATLLTRIIGCILTLSGGALFLFSLKSKKNLL